MSTIKICLLTVTVYCKMSTHTANQRCPLQMSPHSNRRCLLRSLLTVLNEKSPNVYRRVQLVLFILNNIQPMKRSKRKRLMLTNQIKVRTINTMVRNKSQDIEWGPVVVWVTKSSYSQVLNRVHWHFGVCGLGRLELVSLELLNHRQNVC